MRKSALKNHFITNETIQTCVAYVCDPSDSKRCKIDHAITGVQFTIGIDRDHLRASRQSSPSRQRARPEDNLVIVIPGPAVGSVAFAGVLRALAAQVEAAGLVVGQDLATGQYLVESQHGGLSAVD